MHRFWPAGAAALVWLASSLVPPAVEAQKFSRYDPVSLEAVIEPLDSMGNACGICSDEGGAYIDGQDGVAAGFDKFGNLIIDFQAARTPFRTVSFDLDTPFDQDAVPLGRITAADSYLSTIHAPQEPMQLMAPNTSQCASGVVTYTLADAERTQFRLYFQRPLADFDMSLTSNLVVTRVNAETWTVEAQASGCPTAGVHTIARVIDTPTKGPFEYTDRGLYVVPLKMTLTRR
jgi:hypothetical protein